MRHTLLLAASLITGSLLVSLVAMQTSVFAIESAGIGALPAHPRDDNPRTKSIFVYSAAPGATIQDAVTVVNNTDKEKAMLVYPVDSQHSSDGAFACAQAADETKVMGTWIKLAKSRVIIPAKKSETVPFTMTLPKVLDAGEHNGCIAVQEDIPPPQSANHGIVLSFRSALRVALTVPGDIRSNISFVSAALQVLDTKVRISPVLKNDGNVSSDAAITVGLKNVFGMEVARAGGTFALLRDEESRFNFEMDRPFWGGWYQRIAQAEYHPLQETGPSKDDKKIATIKPEWVFLAPRPDALAIEIAIPLLLLCAVFFTLWRRKERALMMLSTKLHVVKKGENIQTIATDAKVNWRMLAKLNHLKPPYALVAGQSIKIPEYRHAKKHAKRKKT